MPAPVDVHVLGQVEYEPTWLSMQRYSQERGPDAADQIWLLQHPPVFTQGQAGRAEHLLQPGDIPVVKVDRGGQVTYHGPGQLVAYVLFDIRRMKTDVRRLVTALEQSVVDVLAHYGVEAAPRKDAPGVYVGADKICSLGLRIKRGCSYHGLALNLDMDLEPFQRINPCGYQGLRMIQLSDFGQQPGVDHVQQQWVSAFSRQLDLEPHWQSRFSPSSANA